MRKRYTALLIISLFLLTNLSSANIVTIKDTTNIKIKNKNNLINYNEIVYVDDDNTEGPWDGTIEHPYQYIQDAIDNSFEGFTIYVFNGSYSENIFIDKSLILSGEDKYTTIIDGAGNKKGILVTGNNATISGFTIKNIFNEWWDCCGITIKADKTTVNNNIITNNRRGILLFNTSETTVENNIFSYNQIIIVENSNNNKFCNNKIIQNSILIKNSNFNKIYDNIIEGEYWTYGIHLEHSSNNCIYYNIIKNCSVGIELYSIYGERNTGCNRNNICYNQLENIKFWAIFIEKGKLNKIHHNNFVKCGVKAFVIDGFLNRWYRNYWSRPRILPKRIFGISNIIIGRFDWLPKIFPNKIL
jgi:parallel beta-helix repeat protein